MKSLNFMMFNSMELITHILCALTHCICNLVYEICALLCFCCRESIHAQLDMLLVQHVLLSDAQLMGIARRIHYTLMARGFDIRQSLVTQAPVVHAGSQEM